MSLTYRHSLGPGQHSFFYGVEGEPEWNPETHELTVFFGNGESITFGPNADGEPIAYGRLLYRDESLDEESGLPVMTDDDPDRIMFNCTFWPLETGDD
jgi:hypothetical protein